MMPYECARIHIELARHELDLGEKEREAHRRKGMEAVAEMGLAFEKGLME